ncbi:Gfo/Idh/MocA family protein [Sphingomonas sp. BAUL-RG-20F-R05-02]|uniref:Gfo/Idh/MocA family protein n=1 Tax=Sphingomonas sp. BAUL-RG-20F-R05-02 TaxID=2914830 RepID=UPI001F592614|nr:Gfo/Idh/MocA family oxidoreductase [Sphingomonas sp. BAUL-RG-20F-R05-02]
MKRLGFLGTGWIGRHRMAAMLDTGLCTAVAICDPSADCLADAAVLAPDAVRVRSLDEMLALDLDGIVIATPSALHAVQSVQVLEAGVAVFCQKPLGRDLAETQGVIDAARKADRLLGVDLSYRHTDAMRAIAPLVAGGDLGKVFAVDLTFHNAYGPDKPWFYDPAQSGGGCVVDLGVHLVDLALWALGFPDVTDVSATLLSAAAPLKSGLVEDYAVASFVAGGVSVRLGCSWRLHAGRDAVIEAAFYGTAGGAALRNVDGSFYDLTAERFDGTGCTVLSEAGDVWGGRAAVAWVEALERSNTFDPAAETFAASARVLDAIYAAGLSQG